jgi:predicted GTPase
MSKYVTDQGNRIHECLSAIIQMLSDGESSLYGIIQDNEECRRDRDELVRLHAALGTYLDTDVDLRYVAFVGAFSSGKTATINSLLQLSEEERRAEDPNPVDERLTLCVHEARRASINSALLKSAWNHEKFFHKAIEFREIILVDTPGAGDPKTRTDIVYNFLPICDTIVYFFNATNPLNTNDLPILREINQVLQHLEFFYVYTRADNVYKIHEDAPLNNDNFDTAKATRQKNIFSARLTEALAGIPIKSIELIFVSNATTKYGIEELREGSRFRTRILAPQRVPFDR